MTASAPVPTSSDRGQFVRDKLIWIYYGLVGLNCYIMSALGPVMPFLRSELDMNYRVAGLHFSAFALGTVFAGTFGDRVLHRLGRVSTLLLGICGTIGGLLFLVLGHHPGFTIFGILVAGFTASMTYQMLATVIADHLGELRTFAFMEAEVMAMLVGGLAPFAVSAFVSAELGWRGAFIVLILLFASAIPSVKMFGTVKNTPVEDSATTGKLPLTFWGYGLIIFLSVAAEWSTAFWSADYLHYTLDISKAAAAASVGAFFIGMVFGRYGGSRLVRVHSPAKLLIGSGVISIVGFLMFWLGHSPYVNITGLFLTGLGIANMYPLSFSAAVASAPTQAPKAIARVSLMGGSAILFTPLALSFIADNNGLFAAYYVIASLLVLCLAAIFGANELSRRHSNSSVVITEIEPEMTPSGKLALVVQEVRIEM